MKRTAIVLIAAASWCASSATTIFDNFPQWDGNITNGWFGQAQSLTVPVVDNVLMEWRFEMAAGNTVGQVGVSIQTLSGGLPSGSTLWTSSSAVPGAGGVITFNNIGLTLVSGTAYGFVVDFMGYSGQTIHFSANGSMQGDGMWFDGTNWSNFGPDLDQKIYARFEAVPEPGTFILLGMGLVGLAARRLRK